MSDSKNSESLISHLEALRSTLIKCLLALFAMYLPMYFLTPFAMDLLINIIKNGTDLSFNFFSPMEVFILKLKIALVLDILVCLPYIAKTVWTFIVPALYENERRFIRSIVLSSSLLFIIGVLFCLFLILPLVIKFGLSFQSENIKPVLGIGNIISLALYLSVVFGLMFQFPLVTYSLVYFELTSYQTLKTKRTYVFVAILILSGVLTPPDIISQLMLTIPTYALFEAGLFFARRQSQTAS